MRFDFFRIWFVLVQSTEGEALSTKGEIPSTEEEPQSTEGEIPSMEGVPQSTEESSIHGGRSFKMFYKKQ